MTLFSMIATLLGVARAIPQLIRLLRARHARGVSADSAATSMIVSSAWMIYGFLTHQPSISFASGALGITFLLTTMFALRFGRRLREIKIAPVWLVVLLLMGNVGGSTGLGIALAISVLAANLPQVWVAYREGNLTDLSLGMWLFSMTDGLLWGGYGLVQQDFSVLLNNTFQLITSGMIVALKLAHTAKHKKNMRPLQKVLSSDSTR